jgi:hypothetical protein
MADLAIAYSSGDRPQAIAHGESMDMPSYRFFF